MALRVRIYVRREVDSSLLTQSLNGANCTVHKNRDMISLDQDTNGRDGLFTSLYWLYNLVAYHLSLL